MTPTTPERTCCIDDCAAPFHGKGMCRSHYMKVWRGQMPAPQYVPPVGPTESERFWAKVATGSDDECWIWQASLYSNGYGQFANGNAHRFAYEDAVGPIPGGLVIDHLCQRRQCVNPRHLEPVTQAVNVRRGYGPTVAAARERQRSQERTHCSYQHELTPENTYVDPTHGWRACRTCRTNRNRRRARTCTAPS